MDIRFIVRNDMPEVLAIEREAFRHPWYPDDFFSVLRERCCMGIVATVRKLVVGYAITELRPNGMRVLNMAVRREYRRQGIASAILQRIQTGITESKLERIAALVSEENVEAQVFFKACGFQWTRTQPKPYRENDRDGYVLTWRNPNKQPKKPKRSQKREDRSIASGECQAPIDGGHHP